jgi:tetratricopeptide (TPR) repeat protein
MILAPLTRALACLAIAVLLTAGTAFAEERKETDPKYRELVKKALTSHKGGDAKKALEELDQAIAIDPKFFVAYAAKALILTRDKRFKEAIDSLNVALTNSPDEDNLYIMRAEAYLGDNQKDKAIEDLRKVKQLCAERKDVAGETVMDTKIERITTPALSDAKITWRNDVAPLLDGKEKTDKLILIDVYTDWCGWCKVMDEKTFSDPYVAKFMTDNFICVKLNAEDKGEGTSLASALKVDGFPCTCILDVNKKANTNISGFAEPDTYLTKLKLAIRALKEDKGGSTEEPAEIKAGDGAENKK